MMWECIMACSASDDQPGKPRDRGRKHRLSDARVER